MTTRGDLAAVADAAQALAAADTTNDNDRLLANLVELLASAALRLASTVDELDARGMATVVDIHTRTVPEPRVLPGETLGDYWNRTGEAAGWPGKNVVPLTEDEA